MMDMPPVVIAEKYVEPQIVIDHDKVEIFRCDTGCCLRGPLKFFNLDGTIAYELKAGVWYPTGCWKRR